MTLCVSCLEFIIIIMSDMRSSGAYADGGSGGSIEPPFQINDIHSTMIMCLHVLSALALIHIT